MKYSSIFTLIAFFVLSTGNVFAQNDDIEASATILQDISVEGITNMAFGEVTDDATYRLLPNGTWNDTNTSSDGGEQVGQFQITSAGGAEIELDFTPPANLSDGTNEFTFNLFDGAASYNNGTSDVTFDPTSTTTLTAPATEFNVNLGGEIVVPAGQVGGTYTGTISLAVTYVNI